MSPVAEVLTFILLSPLLVEETWAFASKKSTAPNSFSQRSGPEISAPFFPTPRFEGFRAKIDLDGPIKIAAERGAKIGWNASKIFAIAEKMKRDCPTLEQYVIDDLYKDWLMFSDDVDYIAIFSVHIPLALSDRGFAYLVQRNAPKELVLVNLTNYGDKNLRASRELLKQTVMPNGPEYDYGVDYDTEGFSARFFFGLT